MRFPPDREDRVSAAIRRVVLKAQDATLAPDTDAARKRLNEVWWAVHEAAEALNEAERVTRAEALQNIEGKAA